MASIDDDDAAKTLARELDAYLDGDMTTGRVGEIEGALSRAEVLSSRLSGFEDLEFAAAMFNPRGGSPYLDQSAFERVARMVREEIRSEFGA
jgi:hypothetical protein